MMLILKIEVNMYIEDNVVEKGESLEKKKILIYL